MKCPPPLAFTLGEEHLPRITCYEAASGYQVRSRHENTRTVSDQRGMDSGVPSPDPPQSANGQIQTWAGAHSQAPWQARAVLGKGRGGGRSHISR
jgi:hypothetical protein